MSGRTSSTRDLVGFPKEQALRSAVPTNYAARSTIERATREALQKLEQGRYGDDRSLRSYLVVVGEIKRVVLRKAT